MKKFIGPLILGLLIGAAALYLVLGRPALPGKARPAKGSFDRVAAKLDDGGDFYFFYSLERLVPLVEEIVRTIGEAVPVPAEKKEAPIGQALNLIGQLGLGEIDAVGASSMTVEKDLFRTRMVIHHPPDRDKGLIWAFMGGTNHDLDIVRRLPASTVLANMFEIQTGKILDWLKTALPKDASGKPDIAKSLAEAEAKGIPLEKIILSLQGPLGYFLTLDPQKKITLPLGGQAVELPEPGLALAITAQDSAIFDFLKDKIPGASYSEKDGARRLQFAAPPAPFTLAPTIAWKDKLLVAATTESLAEALIAGTAGNRLTETEAFRRLSRDIPLQGTGFSYLGPELTKIALEVLGKITPPGNDPAAESLAALVRKYLPADLEILSVVQNGPEGMSTVINHSVPPEKLFLLPFVSAMAFPRSLRSGPAGKVLPPVKF
jgi:hypothetical protein